jgi:hypothetical protein
VVIITSLLFNCEVKNGLLNAGLTPGAWLAGSCWQKLPRRTGRWLCGRLGIRGCKQFFSQDPEKRIHPKEYKNDLHQQLIGAMFFADMCKLVLQHAFAVGTVGINIVSPE